MPDLGKKHECPNCGIKFYDLGNAEPVCPKCRTNVKKFEENQAALASQAARRRRQAQADAAAAAAAAAEDESEEFDVEVLEDAEEEEEEEEQAQEAADEA
jgi:uncharacterized protein (TIGR02300 family)